MTAGEDREAVLTALHARSRLGGHRFESNAPVLGRLIALVRTRCNVAAHWFLEPELRQQSEFNLLVVEHLALTQRHLTRVQEWLIDRDREDAELRHDLGEIAVRLGQLNRLLEPMPGAGQATRASQLSDPAE